MSVHPLNRRRRGLAVLAALVASLGWPTARPAAAADDAGAAVYRVRSTDRAISAFIDLAATRSLTFRKLVAVIEASDGIVYIEPGPCGHGTRACLKVWMGVSGPNRFLRVMVDRRKSASDADFMGSIGHELQHTVEALSEPATINSLDLYNFFSRIAPTSTNAFETAAAINAGDAVRAELRSHRSF
jgi:hypothetical protein